MAHAWKACWCNSLTSSNLVSSALTGGLIFLRLPAFLYPLVSPLVPLAFQFPVLRCRRSPLWVFSGVSRLPVSQSGEGFSALLIKCRPPTFIAIEWRQLPVHLREKKQWR